MIIKMGKRKEGTLMLTEDLVIRTRYHPRNFTWFIILNPNNILM